MSFAVLQGVLLSFLGTTLGAACVLFMKKSLNPLVQRDLTGFAAEAIIYMVEELIPEMFQGKHSNLGTVCFSLGFTLMLALDVALG